MFKPTRFLLTIALAACGAEVDTPPLTESPDGAVPRDAGVIGGPDAGFGRDAGGPPIRCHEDPCKSDEYCRPGPLLDPYRATCVARAAANAECQTPTYRGQKTCVDGWYCGGSRRCVANARRGEICQANAHEPGCVEGLACRYDFAAGNARCEAAGATCLNHIDCPREEYCTSTGPYEGRCAPRQDSGGPCHADNIIGINGQSFVFSDACNGDMLCEFTGSNECLVWLDCQMSQVSCCDDGDGGRCVPTRMCTPPTGACTPRP